MDYEQKALVRINPATCSKYDFGMGFSFHPPTRTYCQKCEELGLDHTPIVDYRRGKASSADNFPVHNWFNFVLGYSPEFPEFMFEKLELNSKSVVADPFSGSGTTLVCAKSLGIKSVGVEANDYFHFAASVKTNWKLNSKEIHENFEIISKKFKSRYARFNWDSPNPTNSNSKKKSFVELALKHRPDMLDVRYISDHTFAQFCLLNEVLSSYDWGSTKMRDLYFFAMSSILVPASNIRYGPGFGVSKKVQVVDVFSRFEKKMDRIMVDLESQVVSKNKNVSSKVYLGDSRRLSNYLDEASLDAMITSPPYPGDHEYTKHSRLELIFGNYAQSLTEFRTIKKRMLTGSTTNIYREDNLGELVASLKSIAEVTSEIDARLEADGATSGFEKLYSKLVREYFGGMYLVFEEARKVLKEGAPFSLLVSDSHAFKMVHISTAAILAEVAILAGFKTAEIELWQLKKTTSHGYQLMENILTVR